MVSENVTFPFFLRADVVFLILIYWNPRYVCLINCCFDLVEQIR